jgi:hypothetical protein
MSKDFAEQIKSLTLAKTEKKAYNLICFILEINNL